MTSLIPDLPPLYVLRHGETEWNLEGRLQGRRDSPLTARGREQAAAQGRLLVDILKIPGMRVACSPQGRAVETARIATAGAGGAIATDLRLQEVSAGEWEGRTRADLFAGFTDGSVYETEFDLFLNAPGGERFNELYDRCMDFLTALSGPTIAVTHGITGSVLRGIVLGLGIDGMDALAREQGCVYMLSPGQEQCLREPVRSAPV